MSVGVDLLLVIDNLVIQFNDLPASGKTGIGGINQLYYYYYLNINSILEFINLTYTQ